MHIFKSELGGPIAKIDYLLERARGPIATTRVGGACPHVLCIFTLHSWGPSPLPFLPFRLGAWPGRGGRWGWGPLWPLWGGAASCLRVPSSCLRCAAALALFVPRPLTLAGLRFVPCIRLPSSLPLPLPPPLVPPRSSLPCSAPLFPPVLSRLVLPPLPLPGAAV